MYFFCRKYTLNGLLPNPKKVEDIIQMATAADKQDLQRFHIYHIYHTSHSLHIYIDMSKAFDLIDFTVLIHKLTHYGIHNTALLLIRSYLTDRKQCCNFKGIFSRTLTISKGVPQGCIFGHCFLYST